MSFQQKHIGLWSNGEWLGVSWKRYTLKLAWLTKVNDTIFFWKNLGNICLFLDSITDDCFRLSRSVEIWKYPNPKFFPNKFFGLNEWIWHHWKGENKWRKHSYFQKQCEWDSLLNSRNLCSLLLLARKVKYCNSQIVKI